MWICPCGLKTEKKTSKSSVRQKVDFGLKTEKKTSKSS